MIFCQTRILGRDWIVVFQPKPLVKLMLANKSRWSRAKRLVGRFQLVKYTLVSQITRVTRRFYLQTSGPRFHYACILHVVSNDE